MSLVEWWETRQAAKELHEALQRTPDFSVWRIPCDVTNPHDARVARIVHLLLQKHPERYRAVWSKKALAIYHTGGYEAMVSKTHRDMMERWGLTLRPRTDAEGLHAPPEAAGGRQFALEGERCDPDPPGGGSPVETVLVDEHGRPLA